MLELNGAGGLVDLLAARTGAFEEVLFDLGLDELAPGREGFFGEDGGGGEAAGCGGLGGAEAAPESEHYVGIATSFNRGRRETL